MAEQIYHLNEQGQLAPMSEEPFELEDRLQELVAEHPGLLSGEQMNPDSPRRFILIGREQGIADIVGGGNRWALDHLLIDQDAVPTLVEAKRSSNPQIRREIVGQMMDYAAHATQTWSVAEIRQAFEDRSTTAGRDPDEILSDFLEGEDPDIEGFWEDVDTNLRAARLRLLFLADGIPDELTRVVEFLNEQMPRIEVLAVEIKQFKGESGITLVPRVIGRTAQAVAATTRRVGTSPSSHNRQSLIHSFTDLQVQEAARRLFEVTERYNATYRATNRSMTICLRCEAWNTPVAVGWLYEPEAKGWNNVGGFHFGAGNFSRGFFESLPNKLRQLLDDWLSEFRDDEFGTSVETTGIRTRAISHQDVVANIDLLCYRLDRVLRELSELQPEES